MRPTGTPGLSPRGFGEPVPGVLPPGRARRSGDESALVAPVLQRGAASLCLKVLRGGAQDQSRSAKAL